MANFNSINKKKKPHWVFSLLIIPMIVYVLEKLADNYTSSNNPKLKISTQTRVDSGIALDKKESKNVFQNSGGGQQNNNSGSGKQTINNK